MVSVKSTIKFYYVIIQTVYMLSAECMYSSMSTNSTLEFLCNITTQESTFNHISNTKINICSALLSLPVENGQSGAAEIRN